MCLREILLERREFIAKITVTDANPIAVEELLHFMYEGTVKLEIHTFEKFWNLMKCAKQFNVQPLIDWLLQLPEEIRTNPNNQNPTEKKIVTKEYLQYAKCN
jgi:hypothetical protein